MMIFPLPSSNVGGSDFALVELGRDGKPACKQHGAMNKVSPSPPGLWRCLGGLARCAAGCQETPEGEDRDAAVQLMAEALFHDCYGDDVEWGQDGYRVLLEQFKRDARTVLDVVSPNVSVDESSNVG